MVAGFSSKDPIALNSLLFGLVSSVFQTVQFKLGASLPVAACCLRHCKALIGAKFFMKELINTPTPLEFLESGSFWSPEPRNLLILSGLVSLACIIYVWRKPGRVAEKIFWSVVLLVPVLGPLFLGAFYRSPTVQASHLRGRENRDIYSPQSEDHGNPVSGGVLDGCSPPDVGSGHCGDTHSDNH